MSRKRATRQAKPVVRHVVLDSEAASILREERGKDPKWREVVLAVAAAPGHALVPTAVRTESGWDRSDPKAAEANRLVPDDDPLDAAAANRAVKLRRQVPAASVVDSSVAVAAERLGAAGGIVEVLTSDPKDIEALAACIDATVDVRRL